MTDGRWRGPQGEVLTPQAASELTGSHRWAQLRRNTKREKGTGGRQKQYGDDLDTQHAHYPLYSTNDGG